VLVDLVEESMGAVEGVLLLIDEADRPASEANLGQLCNLLSERLAKRGCEKVCIGLAGLPALLGKLMANHPTRTSGFIRRDAKSALAREGLPLAESVLLSRLHFGVLRKLEPFASNTKPYFLIEGIYELLG
jgi:hypothetical protein